jgi:hypothetical protein
LIGELLAVAVDTMLLSDVGDLAGVRYVDDYYLYFSDREAAERVLTRLTSAANHFEIEVNPLKTTISELPELLEPNWKTDLRSFAIGDKFERLNLLGFFSKAFDFAAKNPNNNVLKYAVKLCLSHTVSSENWSIYESFLLGSMVNEPGLIPVLAKVLKQYADLDYPIDKEKLKKSLSVVCLHHSHLRQGFEVAWSLWLCKLFSIELPEEVFKAVALVEDPIVALIALDLDRNLLRRGLDISLWEGFMVGDELYGPNWLLAYEALTRGWLASKDGTDYVSGDNFFGELSRRGIRFYDPDVTAVVPEGVWFGTY